MTFTHLASNSTLLALSFGPHLHVTDHTGRLIASTESHENIHIPKIELETTDDIRAIAFSPNNQLFALTTDNKQVRIYQTSSWALQHKTEAEKRVNALAFDPQSECLVVADKSGDAYRVSVDGGKPELLLGHVSILSDLAFTKDGKHLLTCDRDEKLRVSRYPNAYNVETYCLGHQTFVTSVVSNGDWAVTGAGDGTLRVWEYRSGREKRVVELGKWLERFYEEGKAKVGENSFEDKTAAERRLGVLRVRYVEAIGAVVAVTERIPAVVVLPLKEEEEVRVVEISQPPTDIAVLDNGRLVVSCEGNDQIVALTNELAVDEELTRSLKRIAPATVTPIPSMYIWGSKNYQD